MESKFDKEPAISPLLSATFETTSREGLRVRLECTPKMRLSLKGM